VKISEINSQNNVNLSKLSTIKVGGFADVIYYPRHAEELQLLLKLFNEYKIIGRCSNILFPDGNYGVPIISLRDFKLFSTKENVIMAGAGYPLPLLSLQAAKYGLSGLEFANAIPASLGGAVYMNAGAFGGCISDVVSAVSYYDKKKGLVEVAQTYDNSYRYTEFMDHKDRVILTVTMELEPRARKEIKERTASFQKIRYDTQPYNKPSLGSIFKQEKGEPVWKYIDGVGLRGYAAGDAQFSEKHCNFIVNNGRAKQKEVLKLIKLAKERVLEQFGVELHEEIEIWNLD